MVSVEAVVRIALGGRDCSDQVVRADVQRPGPCSAHVEKAAMAIVAANVQRSVLGKVRETLLGGLAIAADFQPEEQWSSDATHEWARGFFTFSTGMRRALGDGAGKGL